MATSKVTLGGHSLRVNPDEIRWNFKMNTNDAKTLGGKVIQITGVRMDNIIVKGQYAPDRTKGDREAWQQQMRFRAWIESLTEGAEARRDPKPLRFTYPPRGWNFNVFVMGFSPIHIAPDEIAPRWELTLFPVEDGTRSIVEGIKDLYIKRLMNGVGWKQTEYNGPTQSEVDDLLAPYGGSVEDYLEKRYEEEAYGPGGLSQ